MFIPLLLYGASSQGSKNEQETLRQRLGRFASPGHVLRARERTSGPRYRPRWLAVPQPPCAGSTQRFGDRRRAGPPGGQGPRQPLPGGAGGGVCVSKPSRQRLPRAKSQWARRAGRSGHRRLFIGYAPRAA